MFRLASAQVMTSIRYEGRLSGPVINTSGGNLSSQHFRVSLYHPACSDANSLAVPLNVTPWESTSVGIANGAFSLSAQFDATQLARAMDYKNDFGVGCPI